MGVKVAYKRLHCDFNWLFFSNVTTTGEEHFTNEVVVYIHDKFDIIDAKILHESYELYATGLEFQINIKKRAIESVSTNKKPCQKYAKGTCLMREIFRYFLDTYNCYIVLNFDGKHLDDLKQQGIGFCNVTVHKIFKNEFYQVE